MNPEEEKKNIISNQRAKHKEVGMKLMMLFCMCVANVSFADDVIECKIEPTGTFVMRYDILISTNKIIVSFVKMGDVVKKKERSITLDEYKKLFKLRKKALGSADKKKMVVTDSWALHVKVGKKYILVGTVNSNKEESKETQKFINGVIEYSPMKMKFPGFA